MVTLRLSAFARKSSSETGHHPLINFPRHAYVVEVVFTNKIEFSSLVEIKDLASFDLGGLAGVDSQRPGDVVETDMTLGAQPPAMHRVEDTSDVVFTEVDERPHLDGMRQTALKNEWKIETDDVVTDKFVAIRVEILHEINKFLERFLFFLFVTVFVDAKHVLTRFRPEFGKLKTRNWTDMKGNRQHPPRSRAQRAERVATFFLRGNVFEIALLLFDTHVAEADETFELRPDTFAEIRQG